MREGEHRPALDGVRGLAILMVVAYHANLVQDPQTPGEQVLTGVLSIGWAGVDLFFVLSGFLITGILLDARGQEGGLKRFLLRRVLRIMPLYFLYLVVVLEGLPRLWPTTASWVGAPAETWWFWTYLPNVFYALHPRQFGLGAVDALWSLGVEEQFYLVWPLVVLFAVPRVTMLVATLAVFVAPLIRAAYVLGFPDDGGWVGAFVLPYCRMDALLLGGLFALLTHGGALPRAWIDRVMKPALLILAAVVVVYVIVHPMHVFGQYHPLVATLGLSLTAWTASAALWHALDEKSVLHKAFSTRGLRFVGRYAYGLYLIHPVVQRILVHHVLDLGAWHERLFSSRPVVVAMFFVVSLALSLAAAVVVFHVYEQRFLALKRLVPRSASPKTPSDL